MTLSAIDSYIVNFDGQIPPELLEQIKSVSELISKQQSPPATGTGLRHRAESDISNFLKVLHSRAYYNAKIDLKFDFEQSPDIVTVKIDTGPIYPFANFTIKATNNCTFPYETIDLADLQIEIGQPALPADIIKAEEILVEILEARGYPLARIIERNVLADQSILAINVILNVDSGPIAFFGPTTISGICDVKETFFAKKIAWQEGALYDPCLIEKTQIALEASGLFRSIKITHSDDDLEDDLLPMEIEVEEARMRSIGAGIAYNTQRGPGLTAEWEHRNIRGMGERLSFDADLWNDLQEVTLLYTVPDYQKRAQDLLWLLEYRHETTHGFKEYSFSLSRIIEYQVNEQTRISYGLMYKRLLDTHSDGNGLYNLFKIPMHVRWSNANSVLEPTEGTTINFRAIPTLHFPKHPFAYCINTLTTSFYKSLTTDNSYVFASKMLLGSIWGSSRRMIPASERFYEGTENTLRGYRFMTVSPLHHHKPIGGRSMLIFSEELRVKATETLGWALFYDLGNVYSNAFPELNQKWLQSVGWGLRYHTPVGPLRLDFAVPLNRRRHLDYRFQIYLSIGQAF
jgi:translocation and assembly module TamA